MNMTDHTNPLGSKAEYPTTLDPSVLFPIARADARRALGVDDDALPFTGVDIWNAWELSWLDVRGKPCAAVAELRVPCTSVKLVESKSLKLYLNGYAMTRFDNAHSVRDRIAGDLSALLGASVAVELTEPAQFGCLRVHEPEGGSLDGQQLDISDYGPPRPEFLRANAHASQVEESLTTNLFRSNCPVTGQPDWASVHIHYRGAPIDRAGLLRYLVSFRDHHDFHEACVERIFVDLTEHCAPQALSVYARFMRRGGIDINPWRATPGFASFVNRRDPRQ
ncbi:MAG: NADPH-dependent 7-cyano-7-deazaguanine reductase QueF [Rhodanobacteraceae bacterium]